MAAPDGGWSRVHHTSPKAGEQNSSCDIIDYNRSLIAFYQFSINVMQILFYKSDRVFIQATVLVFFSH